jgi:tetratricopeptide (TPR) repeat protein
MEKTFCSYHPSKPALWYCSTCDEYFCSDCITRRDVGSLNKKSTLNLCPKCNSIAEMLAAQNLVEPFWNRIPKLFAYPFDPKVVVLMVILAVLMGMFAAPSILSILVELVLLSVLVRYCFAVLKETAKGSMLPPELDDSFLSLENYIVILKFIGLYTIVFGLAGGASFVLAHRLSMAVNPSIGILIYFACILVLYPVFPATVIVLAVTESLLEAINPMVSLRMAFRIGTSYFSMCFFLSLILAAPGTAAYFLQPLIPPFIFAFITSLAFCYYLIVAHHLMGYVILQHHDDIGYEVYMEEDQVSRVSAARQPRPRDSSGGLVEKVNVLIKQGRHEDAAALIQSETGGEIRDLDLAEKYYNLLKVTGKVPEMLDHARDYLGLLVKAQKKDAYRTVYLECVAKDPRFNPPTATFFKVAASLTETGNHRAALEAYNRFIQAAPDDPMVPKAYMMAAGVFHEKMMDTEKAVKTLKRLIKSYPDSEIIPHARKYLRDIDPLDRS